MNSEEHIKRAARIVLKDVPSTWARELPKLVSAYNAMPLVNGKYKMPFSTILLYVVRTTGLNNNILYVERLLPLLTKFAGTYQEMEEAAKNTTQLDALNCQAELDAFGSIESCIVKPRLAISPLYRYIIAHDMCVELLLTDADRNKAIEQLRDNPYFYFEYPEYENLMPITWEEI